MIGHPQWLVGIIVNASLFISAISLSKKTALAVVILPSLGVLARGIIFGPLTISLVYFLPFIWLGNYLLIIVFNKASQKFPLVFSVILSAIVKSAAMFIPALFYVRFSIAPSLFLQLMGINQMLTALGGGIVALMFIDAPKRNSAHEKTKV
jgi:hypothetical protein